MEHSRLSDYDYHLPPELIAQKPLANRDQSRMLVLKRKDGQREHTCFQQFPEYLRQGDLLVLNNTKVIPARLNGIIEGKSSPAELLLLHKSESGDWVAMVKPGKKLKPGAKIVIDKDVTASIVDYDREGLRLVRFDSPLPIEKMLGHLGTVPLPPYITEKLENPDQYQTVYAARDGSAAAPTAGFHFTDQTFTTLEEKGVKVAYLTLHIGPGTFQPVKAEDIREHLMHSERYLIEEETAALLNQTRKEGGRIIAVGTTVCRVLETVVSDQGSFSGRSEGWTDLYIYPGFKFRAVDAMLTNFHLPRSTLLMLISALAGYDLIMETYREAVENNYRFFSFGDCMLII